MEANFVHKQMTPTCPPPSGPAKFSFHLSQVNINILANMAIRGQLTKYSWILN